MAQGTTVTVEIVGGATTSVPWEDGMTVRRALEAVFDAHQDRFTYAVQYYGSDYGHLLQMVNENYDSFDVSYQPDFYWAVRINGTPTDVGIDGSRLTAGDVVSLSYEMYVETEHADSILGVKHQRRLAARQAWG